MRNRNHETGDRGSIPIEWKDASFDLKSEGELYVAASSFEPRCTRTSSLLRGSRFQHGLIFQYEDTLDNLAGRHNLQEMRRKLFPELATTLDILPCRFGDPYSAVRVLNQFLEYKGVSLTIDGITIDITCFTKIHLLLLLRYFKSVLHLDEIRICYTEPLSYASSFGRQLSYGIDRTVYVPYQTVGRRTRNIGLVAFLGHERFRLERIIQELEPDRSIVVLGEPGYSSNMVDYSVKVNESILHRASYDGQYKIISSSTTNYDESYALLEQELIYLKDAGCDTIYFAPLGTKLQAVSFEMLRRAVVNTRMLLAYTIPRTYERNLYSQGSGRTFVGLISSY